MVPELKAMVGFEQNNIHHVYDVWRHTMKALSSAGDDAIVRLAVLFHDIGKPQCYTKMNAVPTVISMDTGPYPRE